MKEKKTNGAPNKHRRTMFVRLGSLAISGVSLALLAALTSFMAQDYGYEGHHLALTLAGIAFAFVGLVLLLSIRTLLWVIEWEIHAVMREFANDYKLRLIDDGTRKMKEAVLQAVRAMVEADRRGFPLSFREATKVDLSGKSVMEVVETKDRFP